MTSEADYLATLFHIYLTDIEAAANSLPEESTEPVRDMIVSWRTLWMNGREGWFSVSQAAFLEYAILLIRLAEPYSFLFIAEEILGHLSNSALRREPWIPDPASVLTQAGEYHRRRGDLASAEIRYTQATEILERELTNTNIGEQTHRTLGRLFYEIAYLHLLRGDSGSTRSTLERSEVECEIAEDKVGAEIARTLIAAILCEEGAPDKALYELRRSRAQFRKLMKDPDVQKANRSSFARRWVINTQYNMVLAYLALGNYKAARRVFDADAFPTIIGLTSVKRLEAQLLLVEGNLVGARAAIDASWEAIEGEQQGSPETTELAAAVMTVDGVIHSLDNTQEGRERALSCFERACKLPADLNNRRAQGCAWAGRAILAIEAGDHGAALAAVQQGLTLVQRCGATVRRFLLNILENMHPPKRQPNIDDLARLVCQT